MSGYRVLNINLALTSNVNPALDFTAKKMRVISAYFEDVVPVSAAFDIRTNLYPYSIALVASQGDITTYDDVEIPINYSGGIMSLYLTENDNTAVNAGILTLQVEFLP